MLPNDYPAYSPDSGKPIDRLTRCQLSLLGLGGGGGGASLSNSSSAQGTSGSGSTVFGSYNKSSTITVVVIGAIAAVALVGAFVVLTKKSK